jgi:hypothetical protein
VLQKKLGKKIKAGQQKIRIKIRRAASASFIIKIRTNSKAIFYSYFIIIKMLTNFFVYKKIRRAQGLK